MNQEIREMSAAEVQSVAGGLLPLLIGAALLLGGCAHINPYVRKDPPPGK
jgi:lactobin A/cerein 7B family class IIb bacteriocin